MNSEQKYNINLDAKFGLLQLVDIPAMVEACHEKWFNQTLCRVNDSVVRLAIVEGEFHWHKHDNEDEFFLVLSGKLHIDIENADSVTLLPHQGFTVPKGVNHMPRAPERTVMLTFENASVNPTGDQ